MAEYRPVPEDDAEAYRRVQDYAFRPEAGPNSAPSDDSTAPDGPGERRALYADGRLVTTATHYPFTIAVRGDWVTAVGLGGVATRPEARHQGHVRTVVRESLGEYRDQGWPFALLWPFDHPFYRRFGWGRLGSIGRYEFEPASIAAVTDHPLAGGCFERLTPEDLAALQQLDERMAESTDLTMRRTEPWYRHRFFDSYGDEPYVYGWFTDGRLGGYLRYEVNKSEGERELQVSDFGSPDPAATVNLLRFLHGHAAQTDSVRLHAAPEDLLFDLVDDPLDIDLQVLPGPMGRLVDVITGLETLPAPADLDTTLTLSVTDDLVDWNNGRFTLTTRDERFEVQYGGGEVDVALPIETLSRLAFGSMTAQRAAEAGDLEADEAAGALLTDLFPPRDSYLREFF